MEHVKMTKKLLDNYKRLKREIPILEMELEEMRTTDSGLGSSTILDYRTGYGRPQRIVGFDWPLYECRQRILEQKKDQVQAVEKWIQDIDDGQARCIFKMFYVDGMSWPKIALKTGYAGSPDYPRLYVRDKYLKKYKIV